MALKTRVRFCCPLPDEGGDRPRVVQPAWLCSAKTLLFSQPHHGQGESRTGNEEDPWA